MEQTIQKYKRIFAGIFLFILVFSFFGSCCKAEINDSYGYNSETYTVDLDKKVSGSVLWDAIAQLIYGVGSLIEYLVGGAMGQLTGSEAFPWADRIIFNTMPMLDINFLNPSNGSMFKSVNGNELVLSKIVKNVYFTILSLAVGFLGVAIGIMAIRLAISSIASEKAKYKEAIMNWLLGIVMLFTMHFILSFVFYTNEQVVKIASNILKDTLDSDEVKDSFEPINDFETYKTIATNFVESQSYDATNWGVDAFNIGTFFINPMFSIPNAIIWSLNGNIDTATATQLLQVVKTNVENDDRYAEILGRVLQSAQSDQGFLKHAVGNDHNDFIDFMTGSQDGRKALAEADIIMDCLGPKGEKYTKDKYDELISMGVPKYLFYTKDDLDDPSNWNNGSSGFLGDDEYRSDYANQIEMYITYFDYIDSDDQDKKAFATGFKSMLDIAKPVVISYKHGIEGAGSGGSADSRVSNESIQIISDMGTYFKESAWTYETDSAGKATGWKANKLTLGGATLYAIFIVQSLMYFIQYIKRFFYIIILSLMGPIVVLYDFVTKSMK